MSGFYYEVWSFHCFCCLTVQIRSRSLSCGPMQPLFLLQLILRAKLQSPNKEMPKRVRCKSESSSTSRKTIKKRGSIHQLLHVRRITTEWQADAGSWLSSSCGRCCCRGFLPCRCRVHHRSHLQHSQGARLMTHEGQLLVYKSKTC